MSRKKMGLIAVAIIAIAGIALALYPREPSVVYAEIHPVQGEFLKTISATGTVTPENRIVVNAPINGRIDRIEVEDGTTVKKGQVLAWMSSQDRAALIDAMRGSGGKENQELAQMYRPTPIVAPEGGQIISKAAVRGQNVGIETLLFEISDRLIFIAKVDETDIGKISLKQEAQIRVDAFPDQVIMARTHHIVHQSTLNNNITTYDVMVEPTSPLPENLRSGMSITVRFVLVKKDSALTLPSYLAEGRQNISLPLRVRGPGGEVQVKNVGLGLSNGEVVEVTEGLNANDVVLSKDLNLPTEPSKAKGFLGSKKR